MELYREETYCSEKVVIVSNKSDLKKFTSGGIVETNWKDMCHVIIIYFVNKWINMERSKL